MVNLQYPDFAPNDSICDAVRSPRSVPHARPLMFWYHPPDNARSDSLSVAATIRAATLRATRGFSEADVVVDRTRSSRPSGPPYLATT